MLNFKEKKEALQSLAVAEEKRDAVVRQAGVRAEFLFDLRVKCIKEVLPQVNRYIDTISNQPAELLESLETYAGRVAEFKSVSDVVESESFKAKMGVVKESTIGSVTGAALGVATGAATKFYGPKAAVAIATTFGTTSTGVPISTLHGIALKNAVLAWLGLGAKSAGGAGMAGGTKLLAMFGPLGVAIAGASIVGAGFHANSKNAEIAEKSKSEQKAVELYTDNIAKSLLEVDRLINKTHSKIMSINANLNKCKEQLQTSYSEFDEAHKETFEKLISDYDELSMLLVTLAPVIE